MDQYYTTGEFARMAHVTIRTIRYYDKKGLLKPSFINESGYRMYSDEDFLKLQKILSLKYLGFSLNEIGNMTIHDTSADILKSLKMQIGLVHKKMENLEQMEKALQNTTQILEETNQIDWTGILNLIHLTDMEKMLVEQYKNGENLNIRISLHEQYSQNKQGWFPWVYEQCGIVKGMRILEIGCGDGTLWVDNIGQLAMTGKRNEFSGKKKNIYIELTDISEGMISDARRNIKKATESWKERDIDVSFRFRVASCEKTGAKDESYDLVIANHVLFYCKNVNKALDEIVRVLKPGGVLVCSTYGSRHMQEISRLVSGYDKRIALEADKLFEKFGLDNGDKILKKHFSDVERRDYKDALVVDEAEPLVDYILSCHGNQKEYLVDKYTDFKKYVEKKLVKPMTITKEAGVFVCRK